MRGKTVYMPKKQDKLLQNGRQLPHCQCSSLHWVRDTGRSQPPALPKPAQVVLHLLDQGQHVNLLTVPHQHPSRSDTKKSWHYHYFPEADLKNQADLPSEIRGQLQLGSGEMMTFLGW